MSNEKHQSVDIDTIAELAMRKTLRSGTHEPILMAQGDKRGIMIPDLDLRPTSDERARQMFGLGMVLAKDADLGVLRQVFFVCEAWMNTPAGEEEEWIRPSQDPKRKEVLVVSGLNVTTNDMQAKIYEMKRDEQDTLLSLNHVDMESTQAESLLLKAFVQGFFGMLRELND